ncbi:uncharacterized protein LOC144435687 [Glandiceps talaboti]
MDTVLVKLFLKYCIIVGVFQLCVTLAQQQHEDTQSERCTNCCNGIPGIPGIPGTAGLPGSIGQKGDNGLQGLDGLPGEKGASGEKGDSGGQGQKGTTGKPGPRGDKGDEGHTGVKGQKGIKGDTGSTGAQGIQGPKGDKGETGQGQHRQKVAFSVARTTSLVRVSSDTTIIYNKVYSNIGNGYDVSTGKFTCPVSGMYVFMISALRYPNNDNLFVCIMKNTTKLPCVFANSSGNRESGANSVIIDVQQGDEIWARLGSGHSLFSNTNGFTTFSGYLLFSDTD